MSTRRGSWRAALRLATSIAALGILTGQTESDPPLERLARGRREICRHAGCETAGELVLSRRPRVVAAVIARDEGPFLGGPVRRWRLVIERGGRTWATRDPIGEDVTVCTDEDTFRFTFALRSLEARDVAGGPEPEVVATYPDGRAGSGGLVVLVCDPADPPRCAAPFSTMEPLDATFLGGGRVATVEGERTLFFR